MTNDAISTLAKDLTAQIMNHLVGPTLDAEREFCATIAEQTEIEAGDRIARCIRERKANP